MKTVVLVFSLISFLAACSDSDADLAAALAETGAIHAVKGHPEQAKDALYRALAYDMTCGVALFELAKIADKEGDLKTAGELYRRSLGCLPSGSAKSQAESRYMTLNPIAGKMALLFKDYARSLEVLSKTHTDEATLSGCNERIRILKENSFISKEYIQKPRPDGTIDLMPIIRSSAGIPPAWERTDLTITSPASGKFKIQIPYTPSDDYRFSVEFKRLGDSGVVGILVPTKSGVSQLLYQSPDCVNMPGKPEVPTHGSVKSGLTYTLSLRVTGSKIEALIDGTSVYSTDKPVAAGEWSLKNKSALGFGTQNCRAEFLSVKITEMSGRWKPVVK